MNVDREHLHKSPHMKSCSSQIRFHESSYPIRTQPQGTFEYTAYASIGAVPVPETGQFPKLSRQRMLAGKLRTGFAMDWAPWVLFLALRHSRLLTPP